MFCITYVRLYQQVIGLSVDATFILSKLNCLFFKFFVPVPGFFVFYSDDSVFISEEMTHRIKEGNRDHYARIKDH